MDYLNIIEEFNKIDESISVTLIEDINELDKLYSHPACLFWTQGLFISDKITMYTLEFDKKEAIVIHPKYTPALLKWNTSDDYEKQQFITYLINANISEDEHKKITIENIKFSEIIWIFENIMILSKHLAIMAMEAGYKCFHEAFIKSNWVTIENNMAVYSDGHTNTINEFFEDVSARIFYNNWKIYKD